jgi:hypothetical protein
LEELEEEKVVVKPVEKKKSVFSNNYTIKPIEVD